MLVLWFSSLGFSACLGLPVLGHVERREFSYISANLAVTIFISNDFLEWFWQFCYISRIGQCVEDEAMIEGPEVRETDQ